MGSTPKLDPGRDTPTGPRSEGDEAARQIRAALGRALDRDLTPEHRAARQRTEVEQAAQDRGADG